MTEAQAFVVLGLAPTAEWSAIRAAYRAAAAAAHPDGDTPDVAQFHRVTDAYRVLAATEGKRDVDRHRCPACGGDGSHVVRIGWRTVGSVPCGTCAGRGQI